MYKNFLKRGIDFLLSLLGIIILSPVFLILCIAIKLDSKGPIIFQQKRVGKDKTHFNIYKFRTMRTDTPKEMPTHLLENPDYFITKVGKFLRKTSLDELPQLFNIIKGEMSFVGPRPDVVGYADKLEGKDRIILSVKPGITGPAQLKYRNEHEILSNVEDPIKYNDEVLWTDKVKINVDYVMNLSFTNDLNCIIKTIYSK